MPECVSRLLHLGENIVRMIVGKDDGRKKLQSQQWCLFMEKCPNGGQGLAPASTELPWLELRVTLLPSHQPRGSPASQHKGSCVPNPPLWSWNQPWVRWVCGGGLCCCWRHEDWLPFCLVTPPSLSHRPGWRFCLQIEHQQIFLMRKLHTTPTPALRKGLTI